MSFQQVFLKKRRKLLKKLLKKISLTNLLHYEEEFD